MHLQIILACAGRKKQPGTEGRPGDPVFSGATGLPILMACATILAEAPEKRAGEIAGVERLNKPITTLELSLAVRRAIENRANA